MVKIYSTTWCPSCVAAKQLLKSKGIEFTEINIENEGVTREELAKLTGGVTVPQIVIDDKSIGGYENLMVLNQEGKLDRMISDAK